MIGMQGIQNWAWYHKRLYQHRRAGSAGNESAVYTHLSQSKHNFQDEDVLILDKESRWFERGVREAIYVNSENPSLNRGGGLRHNLSLVYNPIIRKLPRRISKKKDNTGTDQWIPTHFVADRLPAKSSVQLRMVLGWVPKLFSLLVSCPDDRFN